MEAEKKVVEVRVTGLSTKGGTSNDNDRYTKGNTKESK